MSKQCAVLIFCDFQLENFLVVESKREPGMFTFTGGKKEDSDKDSKETSIREFDEESKYSRNLLDESKVLPLCYIPIDEEGNYLEIFYYKTHLDEFLWLDETMNKEGQRVRILSNEQILDTKICLYNYKEIISLLYNT